MVAGVTADFDPLKTVERFWHGWESLDAGAILSTIAAQDDVVIIGTDASEYWVGHDALIEPFAAMVSAFDAEHVQWAIGDPVVHVNGSVARVVGRLTATVRAGEEHTTSEMRATFILERAAREWLIVHAHFSVPSPAPVVTY